MLRLLIAAGLIVAQNAAAQSLPGDVEAALSKYGALNPCSFHSEGVVAFHAGNASEAYSVTSTYMRHDHKFSWFTVEKPRAPGGAIVEKTLRFDGHVVAAMHGANDASWYKITSLNKAQPKVTRLYLPYFEAVGVYCPTQHEDFLQGLLQSNILYLLHNGGKLTSSEGTQWEEETLIRIEIIAANPAWDEFVGNEKNKMEYERKQLTNKNISRHEFDQIVRTREESKGLIPRTLRWVYYLSTEHQLAVRRHERLTIDGKRTLSCSNTAFRSIPGTDIVLATRVQIRSFERLGEHHYELQNTPFMTTDLSVVKVSTKAIPKEQFVLKKDAVAPGAVVIDAVNPELQREDGTVITYVMPASADELDAAVAAASGRYKMHKTRTYIRYIGMIATVAFIIIFAAYRIYSGRAKGA